MNKCVHVFVSDWSFFIFVPGEKGSKDWVRDETGETGCCGVGNGVGRSRFLTDTLTNLKVPGR